MRRTTYGLAAGTVVAALLCGCINCAPSFNFATPLFQNRSQNVLAEKPQGSNTVSTCQQVEGGASSNATSLVIPLALKAVTP